MVSTLLPLIKTPPERRSTLFVHSHPSLRIRCFALAQLLHKWTTERTPAGFVAVIGTVYNCPGAYDGAEGYHTSTVVDCRGRMLRTLEGAEYFLGRRSCADAEEKASMAGGHLLEEEAAALGLLEDLLAV